MQQTIETYLMWSLRSSICLKGGNRVVSWLVVIYNMIDLMKNTVHVT